MKTLKSFPGAGMASCLFLMAAALLLTATPSKAATWGTTAANFFSYFGFTQNWTDLDLGTGSNDVTVSNYASIGGNLGITNSATVTLSNHALITNLYKNTGKTITVTKDSSSQIAGSTFTSNLSTDVTRAF